MASKSLSGVLSSTAAGLLAAVVAGVYLRNVWVERQAT